MLNRRSIGKLSGKSKVFGVVPIALFSIFWSIILLLAVGSCWETVSLRCQPRSEQVICDIQGGLFLGPSRTLTVSKAQLSGVQVIRKAGKKTIDRIVFSTINGQEIPLNLGIGGDVTIQLNEQVHRIQKFIADPQAQTLTVETQRKFPWPFLPITLLAGFMFWQANIKLKKIWYGS
jgi:hypothetical protein